MSCWLFLPVLNEYQALQQILPEVQGKFDVLLVVDGGSTDGSVELCKQYPCHIIHQPGKGKGNAVRMAMGYALEHGASILCMMDADTTCKTSDIQQAATLLQARQLDLVTGNRFGQVIDRQAMSWINEQTNHLVSKCVSIRQKTSIHDVQTPFWVFSAQAVGALLPHLQATQFEIEVEMMTRAYQLGLMHQEMAIGYASRIGRSKFRFHLKFRHLLVVARIILSRSS